MDFKRNISKVIFFIGVAVLFSSFKFSHWKFNEKYTTIIYKSITEVFNSTEFLVQKFIESEYYFYEIKEDDIVLGYFVIAQAPSKFHQFDHYIIFNSEAEILKIEILKYRENYGAEMCSKKWLENFIKLPTNDYVEYNRKVDGISGSTISVASLKKDVFNLSNVLKKSIDEIEKN